MATCAGERHLSDAQIETFGRWWIRAIGDAARLPPRRNGQAGSWAAGSDRQTAPAVRCPPAEPMSSGIFLSPHHHGHPRACDQSSQTIRARATRPWASTLPDRLDNWIGRIPSPVSRRCRKANEKYSAGRLAKRPSWSQRIGLAPGGGSDLVLRCTCSRRESRAFSRHWTVLCRSAALHFPP